MQVGVVAYQLIREVSWALLPLLMQAFIGPCSRWSVGRLAIIPNPESWPSAASAMIALRTACTWLAWLR